MDSVTPAKLCSPADLALCVRLMPRPLVFTSGVFDMLHCGHVQFLAAARALGRSLVVGLHTDRAARELGAFHDRPLNSELDRACVLGGLVPVTMILMCDEAVPRALLQQVRPDIYARSTCDPPAPEEAELVQAWGGRIVPIDAVPGYSTSALIDRVRGTSPSLRSVA